MLGGSATPISGARPLLRRAPVDIAPSGSVATPYASKEQEAAWYMEQEESSHPPRSGRERTEKRNVTDGRFTGRD